MGESLIFRDHNGKEHHIEIGPSQQDDDGRTNVYLNVDHSQRIYMIEPDVREGTSPQAALSRDEIAKLAKSGDIRAPFGGNVYEISVEEGREVTVGDQVAILEAMKMQTPIVSEVTGRVVLISAETGQALKPGDKILQIESSGD